MPPRRVCAAFDYYADDYRYYAAAGYESARWLLSAAGFRYFR